MQITYCNIKEYDLMVMVAVVCNHTSLLFRHSLLKVVQNHHCIVTFSCLMKQCRSEYCAV